MIRFGRNPEEVYSSKGVMRNSFEPIPHSYHPFSYYVLGGMDLSGEALNLSGNPVSDVSADLEKATDAGFGFDPKSGWMDIAEQAGVDAYEAMRAQLQTPAPAPADLPALADSSVPADPE